MFQSIIAPVFFLLATFGMLVGGVKPIYDRVRLYAEELYQYDLALERASEVTARSNQLVNEYNSFTTEERRKLLAALPDSPQALELAVELDNIATDEGVLLLSVGVPEAARAQTRIEEDGPELDYNAGEMTLTLRGEYESFLNFLERLESNLRIGNVRQIDFAVSEEAAIDYEVLLDIYWLKP